ncbi:MAG: hypothetical protein ACJAV1_001410 [Paraglaciecola sp.]|jgi:hypothetical protein
MPTKQYPTIDVLKTWENVIKSCDSTCLLGTNLKINALYFDDKDDFYKQSIRSFYHHSIMYGYYADDFVMGFQYKDDGERFKRAAETRLGDSKLTATYESAA